MVTSLPGYAHRMRGLVFQYLSYKIDPSNCNTRKIPIIFIMTSNVPEEYYSDLLMRYTGSMEVFVGLTQTFVCESTLQVTNYEKYDWTMFKVE